MYKGEDLIIAMGAPGSRWSGAIRCLQSQVEINITDENPNDFYTNGEFGWHRGAYWGPNHKQGHNFDNLHLMDFGDCLAEFKKPFTDFDTGVKVIKSHWFSYHIPQLREWFPDAKFLGFWQDDQVCLDWWHTVGGWDITYPHYDWYKNDIRMREQIVIENSHIKEHFELAKNSMSVVLGQLSLKNTLYSDDVLCARDSKFAELMKHKPINEILNDTVQRVYTGII